MECRAKSLAEKPSSELEKRIAVSVRKGFREARHSGFLSFSCAGGPESSGPNVPRGEEFADMKVEMLTAHIIPPPLFQHRACAGTSRLLARAFLLFLVLASGVSFFPQEASAQNSKATYLISGINWPSHIDTISSLTARVGTQSMTLSGSGTGLTSATWNTITSYACTKTSTPTSTTDRMVYLGSGCANLGTGSGSKSVTVTQTMINNGGFVVALQWNGPIIYAQWVPLIIPRGITVSQSSALTLTEGGSAGTYNVKLSLQPAGAVVVRVSSSDGGAVSVNKSGGTAGASQDLTFTTSTWNTDQAITLSAVEDGNATDESVTIMHAVVTASSSSDYGSVSDVTFTATVADDESVELVVSETSLTLTEASGVGRAGTFTVRLGSEPEASVSVAVSSGNSADATVDPSPLTFTAQNWATPQTVTVTAVDDNVDDGNQTYDVTLDPSSPGSMGDSDYDGLPSETVSVTTTDDDTKGVTISTSSETIAESGAGNAFTYTVRLGSQPTAQVTVDVTAPSGVATVSPSSLTFDADDTNGQLWSRGQTVTVTAVDDQLDNAADRTGSVTHSVSGGDYGSGVTPGSVSVTLTDDDTAGVTVSTSSVSLTEGGSNGDYTVVLDSEPSASVTVTVTSGDGTKVKVKKGTDTKANSITLTFDADDTNSQLWSRAQTVTVVPEDDDGSLNESVTLTHAVSGSAGDYPQPAYFCPAAYLS